MHIPVRAAIEIAFPCFPFRVPEIQKNQMTYPRSHS